MPKQLTNLTFEEWLTHVFDHPVPQSNENAWYWDMDRDRWEEDSADSVDFLTRAFEDAAAVLEPYTNAQLNQGLWFLASNACSSHMFALMNASVPLAERVRCVRSFHELFEQCFARRCSPHLSHLPEPVENPLNLVCYMWWDIHPLYGDPEDPAHLELDEAALQVMESTLQLDSIPCRESALHGLGHWQYRYPQRVGEIIDRFSMTRPNLPDKLRDYMLNAYTGHVL